MNEQNKYIYYQVVDMPGFTADSLTKNALYFVKSVYRNIKFKQQSSTDNITLVNKFLPYNVMSFSKHESGEIDYSFNVECKDNKYRYWLTDFTFTPYEKNRYGVFVPKLGINMPLETAISRLDKKELEGYLDQTGTFCKQTGEKLKKYMTEGAKSNKPAQQPVKKVVTDKW